MSRYIDANKFAKQVYEVAYPIVHDINSHERGLTLMDIAKLLYDQPTADVVEADKAQKEIDYWHDKAQSYEQTILKLSLNRADVVEVVRCKDCKYWQDNNGGYPNQNCRWMKDETPDADDYCSYGEKA